MYTLDSDKLYLVGFTTFLVQMDMISLKMVLFIPVKHHTRELSKHTWVISLSKSNISILWVSVAPLSAGLMNSIFLDY